MAFRSHASFPSEGAALPERIPGIGWSGHWSFWQAGYPALMITDTAPYRYLFYHTADDTPNKLDYPRMARLLLGVEAAVKEIASENTPLRPLTRNTFPLSHLPTFPPSHLLPGSPQKITE